MSQGTSRISTIISHTYAGQVLVQGPSNVNEKMSNLAKACWQFMKDSYASASISKIGKLWRVPVGFIGSYLVRLVKLVIALVAFPFVLLGYMFSLIECAVRCISSKYRQSLTSVQQSPKIPSKNKDPQTKTSTQGIIDSKASSSSAATSSETPISPSSSSSSSAQQSSRVGAETSVQAQFITSSTTASSSSATTSPKASSLQLSPLQLSSLPLGKSQDVVVTIPFQPQEAAAQVQYNYNIAPTNARTSSAAASSEIPIFPSSPSSAQQSLKVGTEPSGQAQLNITSTSTSTIASSSIAIANAEISFLSSSSSSSSSSSAQQPLKVGTEPSGQAQFIASSTTASPSSPTKTRKPSIYSSSPASPRRTEHPLHFAIINTMMQNPNKKGYKTTRLAMNELLLHSTIAPAAQSQITGQQTSSVATA